MSNQLSMIGLGTDATKAAGYLVAASERLGNFDINFDNTGTGDAFIQLKELTGSGFVNLGASQAVKAGGSKTVSLVLLSKTVGIFGSGKTTINASVNIRNKADLRGADFNIVNLFKRGYGLDTGASSAVIGTAPTYPAA
jgi:hypothetical protein